MADHALPKLEVQDKETQEIVCHIFNFLDQLGGLNQFDLQNLEQFLLIRGVLPPEKKQINSKTQTNMFANPKDQESYYLANSSNYKNENNLNTQIVDQLNYELTEDELNTRMLIELDADANPYKMSILESFRKIQDPFGIEIIGQTGGAKFDDQIESVGEFFDYEKNPAEPSQPQKKVQISDYTNNMIE